MSSKHYKHEVGGKRVRELREKAKTKKPREIRVYDLQSNIIAYEEGLLTHEEVIELFQHLVNNGMAWTLQGSYGRTAMGLIETGEVVPP